MSLTIVHSSEICSSYDCDRWIVNNRSNLHPTRNLLFPNVNFSQYVDAKDTVQRIFFEPTACNMKIEVIGSMCLLKYRYKCDWTPRWLKQYNPTKMSHLYYQSTVSLNAVTTLYRSRRSIIIQMFWFLLRLNMQLWLTRDSFLKWWS